MWTNYLLYANPVADSGLREDRLDGAACLEHLCGLSRELDRGRLHRPMQIAPEVAEALAGGRPVVALESTLISHGLPRPRNLDVAREVEAAVRAGGAVPATVAVVAGGPDRARRGGPRGDRRRARRGQVRRARPRAGRRARRPRRDHRRRHRPPGRARRAFACSPPAGSEACTAARARPGTSRPTSRRSPAPGSWSSAPGSSRSSTSAPRSSGSRRSAWPCSATARDSFPGFYLVDSGHPVPWRVDSPAEVAAVLTRRRELGHRATAAWSWQIRCRAAEQLDPELHDRVLADGPRGRAARAGWRART